MIGEDVSKLKQMKLHEVIGLENGKDVWNNVEVMRVFNGWIYSIPNGHFLEDDRNNFHDMYNHVFVPEK